MKHGTPDTEDCPDVGPENMSTRIEGEFLQEVERAEELAKAIKPGTSLIFCTYTKFPVQCLPCTFVSWHEYL